MEEVDNDEAKRSKDRSPSPDVKSTAVVKYTAFQSPVGYSRLQCNTDLNLPPNWGAALDSYGLKEILSGNTGLSSFRMAHMFPDSVGEVDVISGAECIKKLLKLKYHPKGTVSMMVHRVENTILLDDFDVYDYLRKTEWSWLKDFFYENISKTMSEQERVLLSLGPGPSASRQLTHKFLSHSVSPAALPAPATLPAPPPACVAGPFLPEPETKAEEPPTDHLYNRNVLWTFEDIHMLIGSDLPIFGDKDRPCVSLRLRDAREPINVLTGLDYWLDNLMCNVPEVLMCYHLNGIVQKYEPMKTEDLPTMENSRFSPKVIRNVAQNILSFLKANVTKAGHTYWLFKGPHDDIVKLYDLSSLCPDSTDNPFTTPVAMLLYRVARNMRLTNRTRHVKQLLLHVLELLKEERHPQIVASSHYMLSDLFVPATTNPACPNFKEDSSDSECEEPDYKSEFAQDVSSERDDTTSEHGTETTEKDDASERLSVSESDGTGRRVSESGELEKEASEKDDTTGRVAASLGGPRRGPVRAGGAGPAGDPEDPLRATEGTPDRCGQALAHALRGLLALHNVTMHSGKEEERERLRQQILIEEQHPKMANPYEPIKMNYEPISKQKETKEHTSRGRRRRRDKRNTDKTGNYLIESTPGIDKNAILIRKDKNTYPTWQEPNRDDNFAWKLHLKTLLYEKICLAYATMAEFSYTNGQYGFSLKYIDIASKCQKLLSNMIIKSRVVDAGCLIGRVGDNFFQLSKNWHRLEQFKKQFETDHEIDSKLKLEIENDMAEEVDGVASDEFDLDISLPSSEVSSMLLSCEHYRRAAAAARDKRGELRRRLASVNNELAVRYMNDAQQLYLQYTEEDPNSPKAKLLMKNFSMLSRHSAECLEEATTIFEQVNDVPNLALLYCNKGRYMRFKAFCTPGGFGQETRSLYNKAEELYLSALRLLGPREGAASVRALVAWELSCHLYTKATILQDCPSSGSNASEVADAIQQALKHCQRGGPRQHLYQFRAAMLHHRLASLHHAQYRMTNEDGPKRRTLLNAIRSNYELAANMFASLEDSAMFLTVQMEHVAVLETQALLSPNVKLKSLQTAVQLLRQSHSIMKLIKDRGPDEQKDIPKPDDDAPEAMKSEHGLLSLYEGRLHFILKSIIQYCRSKSNKDYDRMTDMYKKLYCASLKIKKHEDVRLYAGSICEVLTAMNDISKEFE
ncbi:LOW QUALITY PROTEIN: erythroid differentiation-related factor 1 [Aphomia sociella]